MLSSASRRRPSASAGRRTRRRRCPGRCRARARRSRSGTSTCGPSSDARMCEGAFGPSASTCFHDQLVVDDRGERHLEVVEEVRVDLLVDRDARGRVRDVDERGAALGVRADRLAHLRGDVQELGLALGRDLDLPHGRVSYATHGDALREQPRRLPRRGGSLHRGARRGVLPPLRGPEGELRARADLRALRRPDDPRRGQASSPAHAEAGGAGEVELWHFACEGYLGNLTREEAEAIAELEASLEASVDGERSRTACCARRSRTRPTAAGASASRRPASSSPRSI